MGRPRRLDYEGQNTREEKVSQRNYSKDLQRAPLNIKWSTNPHLQVKKLPKVKERGT